MEPLDPAQAPYAEEAGLQLDQVSVLKGLGHSRVIDQVSFTVLPGSKVGIVGASGAGKTTLLKLMNRLVEPTEGQVLWQGQPLAHCPVPALRQRIMLVPQEPRLLGMTVEQALAYPLQLQQMPAPVLRQRVDLWSQRLEIPEQWHSRQELELSVGQRQWVSLSRALMTEPQILLLDEPTSALDPGRVELLIHALKQLSCTVLIVSHQLSIVKTLCQRILWMDQGRLRQDKPVQHIDWQDIQGALSQEMTFSDWDDLP